MKKTIIVSGASQGIGAALTTYFIDSGHFVIALARNGKKLHKLKETLDGNLDVYPIDLSNVHEVANFMSWLNNKNYSVDILINNAGLLVNKPFAELTDDDWDDLFHINVMAPVRLIRGLVGRFNRNSHIVNISSMGGFQGSTKYPGLSAYSTTKGSLSILTESLAVEFSEQKISVNCLCLGAVQTEMLSEAFPDYKAPLDSSEMASYIGEFSLNAHKFFNGKILPVALSNP